MPLGVAPLYLPYGEKEALLWRVWEAFIGQVTRLRAKCRSGLRLTTFSSSDI